VCATQNHLISSIAPWLAGPAVSNSRHLSQYALPADALMASAKIKLLSEMLPTLRTKGNKILLFSQWTQVCIPVNYGICRLYTVCRCVWKKKEEGEKGGRDRKRELRKGGSKEQLKSLFYCDYDCSCFSDYDCSCFSDHYLQKCVHGTDNATMYAHTQTAHVFVHAQLNTFPLLVCLFTSFKAARLQGILSFLNALRIRCSASRQHSFLAHGPCIVQVLDVLEWFMQREGYAYVRLDGSTNVRYCHATVNLLQASLQEKSQILKENRLARLDSFMCSHLCVVLIS